ncbi:MAG: hypothetical protein QXI19_05080 [Candidatus Caldarchaeum sp.]
MKRFRRALGLTLMEVLVAVMVIAVTTSLVFVGLRAWRNQSLRVACMQKLSKINEALMLYRTEWGNPHEVVGSTVSLGLPVQKDSAGYYLIPTYVPQFGRTEKERYETFTCPVLRRLFPDFYVSYEYWAEHQFADEEKGMFPYSSATAVLQGATPVVSCLNHYGPGTVWMDRTETYPLIVLALDGKVYLEHITGFLLMKGNVGPYFEDLEKLKYIRQRAPEAFDREMKLLQERRQNRR